MNCCFRPACGPIRPPPLALDLAFPCHADDTRDCKRTDVQIFMEIESVRIDTPEVRCHLHGSRSSARHTRPSGPERACSMPYAVLTFAYRDWRESALDAWPCIPSFPPPLPTHSPLGRAIRSSMTQGSYPPYREGPASVLGGLLLHDRPWNLDHTTALCICPTQRAGGMDTWCALRVTHVDPN